MKRQMILVLISLVYAGLNYSSINAQSPLVQALHSPLPMPITMAGHQVFISSELGEDSLVKIENLEDYRFSRPGNYSLRLIPDPSRNYCSHEHHDTLYSLCIAPYAFTYRPESIRFSTPLLAKQSLDNIAMEISVYVEANSGDRIAIKHRNVSTSGIGTTVEAVLDSKITHLYPGENVLRYQLKGECSLETYIQFNFIDPIGVYHSVGYPYLIKHN